jgi:hypothetical protein
VGVLHTYFKPFADDFGLTYASTWTEVSEYVESYGDLQQSLDNTAYNIGIFRSQNLQLTMRNESGMFSDVNEQFSMFKYTRGRTQVQVTWEPGNFPLVCGFFVCGDAGAGDTIVSEEVTIFQGVIEDINTKTQLSSINVKLQAMGYESLLSKTDIPTDGFARDLFHMPQPGSATAADFFVVYDAAGLAWSAWLDTTGAASAPTSSVYTAIPSGRKARANISASTTPSAVATVVLNALNALTGFSAAITGSVINVYNDTNQNVIASDAQLLFVRAATGIATASVISDGSGNSNGSIGNTLLNAGATSTAGATQIVPGMTVLTAIYNCCNQAPFNALVTVSLSNMTAASGLSGITIDDSTKFSPDQTALDAVSKLLLAIDAVMYVNGGICYVAPRTVAAGTAYPFYGAGSLGGNDDVLDIQNYSSGIAKLWNYWTWDTSVATSQFVQNISSVAQYQKLVNSVKPDFITNSSNQPTILNAYLTEYGVPKREFDIVTPFQAQALANLFLLSPVSIDVPGTLLNPPNQNVAYYGQGTYGVDYYADTNNQLFILPTDTFKIMGIKYKFSDQTVTYSVRAI